MINEYWRSQLDVQAKRCYDILLEGAKKRQDRISCGQTRAKAASDAYFALIEDHPELFYLANEYASEYFKLGIPGIGLEDVTVDMIYLYSSPQIMKARKRIDEHISELKKRTADMDDRQKVIETVEYVVAQTTYEIDNEYNQNAAAALYFGYAQCSGISKAVKLLLDSIDVPCIIALGEAYDDNDKLVGHAWCVVSIDGRYYHIDPTYMLGSNPHKSTPLTRCWLFYDDATLSKTHVWDRSKLPACTDASLKIDAYHVYNVPFLGNVFRNLSSRVGEKEAEKQMSTEIPSFGNLSAFRAYLKQAMIARQRLIACRLDISTDSFQVLGRYVKSAVNMVRNELHFDSSVSLDLRSDGLVSLKIKYDD